MDFSGVTLHESAKDPATEMWFAEPAGFTALPLDALLPVPGTPAADDLRTAFAPFLDAAPNEVVRQQFIAQLAMAQQLLGALREVGTVHCSIGLHRDDIDDAGSAGGKLLLSWFTIAWRDIAVAPRAVTAARALTSAAGQERGEFRELSCGPAAFCEATSMPTADSGLPQQQLLQFHGYLPHPDCKRLAILTLSTTALARREQYRTLLHEIAETVTFEDPLTGEDVARPPHPG